MKITNLLKLTKSIRAILAIYLTVFSLNVFSGAVSNTPVRINHEDQWAIGAMQSAARSNDDIQYIGCTTYSSGTGICLAKNSEGESVMCFASSAQSPKIIELMNSANSDSLLHFYWDDEGVCTQFILRNFSYNIAVENDAPETRQ